MYNIPSDDEIDFSEETAAHKLFDRRKETIKNGAGRKSPTIAQSAAKVAVTSAEEKLTELPIPAIVQDKASKPSEQQTSSVCLPSAATASAAPPAGGESAVETTTPAPARASASGSGGYRILVNKRQKGNPVLKFIRNVPWEYDAIVPDYELGQCNCALYLSLKYHNRFPEYVHSRLKELGRNYELRILLVQVDTKQQDVSYELNQLAKICILADCTLILAFSYEEAGRYLEVYKAYEHKTAADIMGKTSTDYLSQANDCLTTIKGVNKTDVVTLLTRFKTLKNIMAADLDSLGLCPGIGPLKARRLHVAFNSTFIKQSKASAKRPAEKPDAASPSEAGDKTDPGTEQS